MHSTFTIEGRSSYGTSPAKEHRLNTMVLQCFLGFDEKMGCNVPYDGDCNDVRS